MTRYRKTGSWNGEEPINDPDVEYHEDIMYINYKENIVECKFESKRLVHGFLRNKKSEIEVVHYLKNKPVAVEGNIPLGCLTIKNTERTNTKSVINYEKD